MIEYVYKGFKVSYEVKLAADNPASYLAEGYVKGPTNEQQFSPQKFNTEYPTYEGAEQEIKKLLENYIDFEWREFKEMH